VRLFIDRVHRLPRLWSNREIAKFAPLFTGDVVNVSAWTDTDKEGKHYRDYFTRADSYTITNFEADARGYQGQANEIFLDLEKPLPAELEQRFDVVFNHTTLEHIYELQTAFDNLCGMSRDVVMIVAPFLQQFHAHYGDFWRITPLAMKRMFEDRGLELLYQSFNSHRMSSVYLFAIASRNPQQWQKHFDWSFSVVDPKGRGAEPYAGCRAIPNVTFKAARFVRRIGGLLKRNGAPKSPDGEESNR